MNLVTLIVNLSVNELKGCTSDDIFSSLMSVIDNNPFFFLEISKLIGFASDGAAVMTGVKKGVSTLIKGKNPLTLSIHCLAHRLPLASEKACKQIPYMVKYLEVVNRLGKLCKFSPKFCRLLANSKKAHESDALKLKKVFSTRWLSFNDTVESLVSLESLIACLHTTSKDASHGVTASEIFNCFMLFVYI
jgi:hypothetical protein